MKKKTVNQRVSSFSSGKQIALFSLVGLVYFLISCLCGPSSIKIVSLLLLPLTLVGGMVCFSVLRDRLTPPVLALALVCIMGGLSTCYAVSGKFALNEFLKLLCAFCMVLLLLCFCQGKDPGRQVAQVLAVSSALAGLVSVDLISTRLISGLVLGILGLFSGDYANLGGVEAGVRMTSLFDNPNFFAGIVGLGVLLSLSLAVSEEEPKKRSFHLCLLFINALSFVLAFSMGASGAIAVAFLVYLLLEHPDRRSQTLVLMVETLVLTVLSAALVSLTSFQVWDGIQPVPVLCLLLGSAGLCALDRFVGSALAAKLKGRAVVVVTAVLLCALVAFALVAYNFTGGVRLDAGSSLRRAIYPQPGSYTLVAQDAPVSVSIESQDQRETMMHTSTLLYEGPLSDAAFTVPEDSLVVYVNFYAQDAAQLDAVTCQGAEESYAIPLGYPLLPGFIANRLQGLFANENAIQRLVFFADGMKLFRRSPVVGLGLGAFENGIRSVQSFDYETKYAHNHYIQTLVETGVVGLVLFVGLLAVSAAAVILARRKKSEDGQAPACHALVPALGAALVFMAIHAGTEVVFSTYPYLPMAFGVFALVGLCCGGDMPGFGWLTKKVRMVCLGVIAVLMLVFGILLCCNLYAKSLVEQNPTMETLSTAAKRDPFEWADYALSYVNSAVAGETAEQAILDQADQYALRLAKVDSNTIPVYLAEYYFRTQRPDQAIEMIEKYVSYVSSRASAWQTAFDLLERYEVDTPAYRQQVVHIGQMLEDWNRENLGTIALSEQSQAFLARMSQ